MTGIWRLFWATISLELSRNSQISTILMKMKFIRLMAVSVGGKYGALGSVRNIVPITENGMLGI